MGLCVRTISLDCSEKCKRVNTSTRSAFLLEEVLGAIRKTISLLHYFTTSLHKIPTASTAVLIDGPRLNRNLFYIYLHEHYND